MPAKRLREFLDSNSVKYTTIIHSTAYTAQEIAALTHTKGLELAKTVMVKFDGKMAMAVIPAPFRLDLPGLKKITGATEISLATEAEFRGMFPDCETGAMPPFGNLFGMPVFADESLTRDKNISFNAGTHKELIRLPYVDFARLVQPKIGKFLLSKAA